jgi:hypothetical protein
MAVLLRIGLVVVYLNCSGAKGEEEEEGMRDGQIHEMHEMRYYT